MVVGLFHYLVVAALLLVLGIFGIFLNRKNVIVILMSIELILLAANLNLVAFSASLDDLLGQVWENTTDGSDWSKGAIMFDFPTFRPTWGDNLRFNEPFCKSQSFMWHERGYKA